MHPLTSRLAWADGFARILESGMHHDPCHSGIVLGVSYVMFFNGSFLYGHAGHPGASQPGALFASPYLMAYNALRKANENLEGCGVFHGNRAHQHSQGCLGSPNRRYDVDVFSYFFVNCIGDYFRGCFFGYDARHAVGSAHHRFGRATPETECRRRSRPR